MPAPSSLRGQVLSAAEVSPPEEYFRGVSPLCRRMLDDMTAVREAYGDRWYGLSYQQQCRVIDQAIVDEATVRRYEVGGGEGPDCEYFPKLKLPTGQKVVCDENLTARGFSCSWRDEHSAPFSWHTRSQMDLTLDTPPATPSHPSTPVEPPPTSIAGEGRVIPGGRAVYTARPLSLPRPPRFRWHYDPPDDPPDPPSVVVSAPRSATLPTDLNCGPKRSPTSLKYMLVRGKGEDGEGTGLLARIRGAVVALTATCLPLRAPQGQTSHLSLHRAPDSGGEPDLRPPHVQAQKAQVMQNQADDPAYDTTQQITGGSHIPDECKIEEGGSHALPSLSALSTDPTLAGYVCSLPDDDDDAPYTAAYPPEATREPAAAHNTTPNTLTPVENQPKVGTTPYIPPPVDLPTPLPTPTISDTTKTVSTTFLHPAAPSPRLPPSQPPNIHDDALSAFSEPDSTTDALDTPREEQPLLRREKRLESEEESNLLYTSVLSSKRESNIPKTGFDFLDNW
ncbi:proteoglycan 4-like isoform X1 [Homarus americanus]|uniref:proteoglycan 4-like isoform X1 n=1 Tax=Homarus americanus TaxID=6706 RepID=UPI001C4519AB|nr:proteoglycan 4-like isoform X1 [Homarus americanus]XP_042220846.1 proteoglycan 4-like isoform X1 [Homarus americanus]